MQLIVRPWGEAPTQCIVVRDEDSVHALKEAVAQGVPVSELRLVSGGRQLCDDGRPLGACGLGDGSVVEVLLCVHGGIDFQNRVGSKFGGGGVASETAANADRRERLRKLAMETVDLAKDPYFMKNHLGTFECKLCLTLHNTEGNYLAHTQGKKHQQNLARRAAREAQLGIGQQPKEPREVTNRSTFKIGRPGYKVTKSRDLASKQRTLLFEVDYPQAEAGVQPRHRFMSAYEQRVEPPNKAFQFLLFACEPYETIAFKVPNHPIDKSEGRFTTNWDNEAKKFALQLYFADGVEQPKTTTHSAPRRQTTALATGVLA